MARIRSIKPEFPQSETMGQLSRDARLLFILLWTIVDDDGRARAASRMLASLLYPYDDDAPKLIDGWLAELEATKCIRRYEVDGSNFLDIPNWLKHQKIDRPTPSRLPEHREPSPNHREPSRALAADLGPRTLDQEEDLSDPNGSAPAKILSPPEFDLKTQLHRRAKKVLGPKSGGVVTKLIEAENGDMAAAMADLEQADKAGDAREFIFGIIRSRNREAPLLERGDAW